MRYVPAFLNKCKCICANLHLQILGFFLFFIFIILADYWFAQVLVVFFL